MRQPIDGITPGPWIVNDDGAVRTAEGLTVIDVFDESVIARDADLRAIAALPDLLAALVATLDDCKECDGYAATMCLEPDERHGTTIPCPRCAQARAALAKAGMLAPVRDFP